MHLAPYNVSTGEDRSVWYDSRISSLETNTHFISDESIQSKCEKKKKVSFPIRVYVVLNLTIDLRIRKQQKWIFPLNNIILIEWYLKE